MERGGYVGYVQNHLKQRQWVNDVNVFNYGVIGDTTDDLLEKLKSEDVLSHVDEADLILFTIGGNDAMEVVENHFLGVTREMFRKQKAHYAKNLETIFTILRNHNAEARIVYIGMYNPFSAYFPKVKVDDEIIKDWSQTGKRVASRFKNTVYVPSFDLFEGKTKQLIYKDNFHPNHAGYDLIGRRVMKHISIGLTPAD
jgi:lysophospholipase L1-like esterase